MNIAMDLLEMTSISIFPEGQRSPTATLQKPNRGAYLALKSQAVFFLAVYGTEKYPFWGMLFPFRDLQ
ncbi:MAG: hypothetical protein CM1200mP15_13660 [Dehalococcoidia bacterium]|nr:MAG: hypothetical protein CM1200mP15_13660 [Dehalococcoidia bacterium]